MPVSQVKVRSDDPKREGFDDFALSSDLALYLPLWLLDGSSFKDRSHYGHLVTKGGGPFWTPQGHSLDGTDDVLNLGNVALFNFGTSDFTIECVYKRVTGGTEGRDAFSKSGGSGIGTVPSYAFQPQHNRWFVQKNATTYTIITASYPCSTVDQWLHVICDRQDATISIMANGILSTDTPTLGGGGIGTGLNITNTYNVKIGSDDYDTWYKGIIAEVIVYTRLFSFTEKIQHYLQAKRRIPWT